MARKLGITLALLVGIAALFGGLGHRFANQPAIDVWQIGTDTENQRSDINLYRSIAARVADGKSYYEEVTQLHRERNYPLRPFYTVRLPTLAFITANVGVMGLIAMSWGLVFASIFVWYRRDPDAPLIEKLGVAGLLAMGGASFVTPDTLFLHGAWCGLLLTLSMGFLLQDKWWPALAIAALALAIREFAVLFVGAMGLMALVERRWSCAAGAMAVGLAFLAGLYFHAQAVAPWVLPSDLDSPSWQGMRGPVGLVDDLMDLTYLASLPFAFAALATVLTAVGWAFLPRREAIFSALWFGSAILLIMVFARANNFYWATIMLPAFTLGVAFLAGAAYRKLVSARQSVDG